MELDLTKFGHVLAIARTRNFSRAAEELGITQPALSRSLAGLEARLGFKVFERGRGGVSVTALGALVLEDAEALLRQARSLDHNLRLYGKGDSGKVAFGMGPLIASLVLPKLGADLLTTRPGLQMRCAIRAAHMLMRDLYGDAIELMFCAGEQVAQSPELTIEEMGAVDLSLIVRSGHPLLNSTGPLGLADLAEHPFASAAEFRSNDMPGKAGALICENYDILREVVLRSDTVWMSSRQLVSEDLARGVFSEIFVPEMPHGSSTVVMVRLKARTLSPSAEAVVAAVRKQIAEGCEKPAAV